MRKIPCRCDVGRCVCLFVHVVSDMTQWHQSPQRCAPPGCQGVPHTPPPPGCQGCPTGPHHQGVRGAPHAPTTRVEGVPHTPPPPGCQGWPTRPHHQGARGAPHAPTTRVPGVPHSTASPTHHKLTSGLVQPIQECSTLSPVLAASTSTCILGWADPLWPGRAA